MERKDTLTLTSTILSLQITRSTYFFPFVSQILTYLNMQFLFFFFFFEVISEIYYRNKKKILKKKRKLIDSDFSKLLEKALSKLLSSW